MCMCMWTIISTLCEFLLVLISAFAIYQYFSVKKQTKRTAATIVYNQMKSFDEYVNIIKTMYDDAGNISNYHMSTLTCAIDSNYWNQNKHVLIPILSEEDVKIIERTYAVVENIETARVRVVDTFKDTNTSKSMALQLELAHMVTTGQLVDAHKFANNFRNLNEGFSLCLPMDVFRNAVNRYTTVSGTITMERLKRMAYKTKR